MGNIGTWSWNSVPYAKASQSSGEPAWALLLAGLGGRPVRAAAERASEVRPSRRPP